MLWTKRFQHNVRAILLLCLVHRSVEQFPPDTAAMIFAFNAKPPNLGSRVEVIAQRNKAQRLIAIEGAETIAIPDVLGIVFIGGWLAEPFGDRFCNLDTDGPGVIRIARRLNNNRQSFASARNPVATTNISALSARDAGGLICTTLVKRFFNSVSNSPSVPPCRTFAANVPPSVSTSNAK